MLHAQGLRAKHPDWKLPGKASKIKSGAGEEKLRMPRMFFRQNGLRWYAARDGCTPIGVRRLASAFQRPWNIHRHPISGFRVWGVFDIVGIVAMLLGPQSASAQLNDRTVPTKTYHAAFAEFHDGDYKTALERFRSDSRSAIKTTQSRWIDSICYETMQGECYYQMGMYPEALGHYTAALEIYQVFPNWLVQVVFRPIVRDIGNRRAPPWQVRQPMAPLGSLPATMLLGQGSIDSSPALKSGGMVNTATQFPIEPAEILRCTTLAIRRRGELLGPLAAHDPLFDSLIANLQRRPGPPNHWSEAWINLELGLALSAGGRGAQALAPLQKSTIAQGEFEHPLTAIAHLELGRLSMASNDFAKAAQHFDEASYASYYYADINHIPDVAVMEEAFRYGALNHILANGKGLFPPLVQATAWAKAGHYRHLYASLLMLTAENQIAQGRTQLALAALEDARGAMGNKSMASGRIGARRNFLHAAALYQAGKIADADANLGKAMAFMRQKGSLWLFHIQNVDDYYTGGGNAAVSAARAAVDLFQTVLRDPQPADWLTDPMESLAVLMEPHGLAYEHWFEAAVARKEHELALEVADRARRHRFLSHLALGGRLESLRWVLEGPKELLPAAALLQRQDLLTRYPGYKDVSDQAQALRRELAAIPLLQDNSEKSKKLAAGMAALATLGRRQELVLREMAVRRDPAALAFPPVKSMAEIQKALPKGHAMLVFFATSRNMYAFLLTSERYIDWPVAVSPQTLAKQTSTFLRDMGNISQNYELTAKDLAETKWRQSSQELLNGLLKGSRADFTTKFDELIVVPDGLLWYVPFEALNVQADGRSLISRYRIRYAPTAALAVSNIGIAHRQGSTAIVVGKLHPKLDDEAVTATVGDLTKSLRNCTALKNPLPAAAPLCANFIDRLLVFDELSAAAETDPFGWAPIPADRSKAGVPLSDWLVLPRRGPDEVILPGYHTASEGALKRSDAGRKASRGATVDSMGAGNEVFLSLCGMMATGTRTILLSRWRSGGQSSLDLIREFTQELPYTTPADAWQRAVQVVSDARLNPEAEPRIKRATTEQPSAGPSLKASHPFFWAGYLLVDAGSPEMEPPKPK